MEIRCKETPDASVMFSILIHAVNQGLDYEEMRKGQNMQINP